MKSHRTKVVGASVTAEEKAELDEQLRAAGWRFPSTGAREILQAYFRGELEIRGGLLPQFVFPSLTPDTGGPNDDE